MTRDLIIPGEHGRRTRTIDPEKLDALKEACKDPDHDEPEGVRSREGAMVPARVR
jgi:hypothetical protein